MTLGQAVKTVLVTKYATFDGRATRSEYWWYQLCWMICGALLLIPMVVALASTPTDGNMTGTSQTVFFAGLAVFGVFVLATLVPGLAVTVRRLHDVGMSGWMYLISLVPYAGGLFLLVAACLDSKPANKWGPNPKDPHAASPYAQYNPALTWQPAPASARPPAGWYADPGGAARLRYWDGAAWTEHVSD
jgi:uncharacterized membrane protein YhaH (DUF805 family)